jgi:hypothetical protein
VRVPTTTDTRTTAASTVNAWAGGYSVAGKEAEAHGRLLSSSGLGPAARGLGDRWVCAGLGRRFGLSPWTARILFVLVLLVIPGSQLIVYPILWVLMPSE